MKKVFGVLLIIVATLLILCILFLISQLINHLSLPAFTSYEFGYIIGSALVIGVEVALCIFLFKKGKNLLN